MQPEPETYDQLLAEVVTLRRRVADLESVDPLTGLMTRARLEDIGSKEIARTHRYGHPLSVIVFAIDDFASLDARFGDQAGEAVLARLAKAASEQIRHPDSLFRLAGEEFLLLLPETDLTKARMIAGRLQATLREVQIPFHGQTIRVTISAGAATYLFVEVNLDVLISNAEDALEQAHAMGSDKFFANEE